MKTFFQKTLILGLVSLSIYSCCCPDNPNPNGLITTEEGMDLSNLYIANQYVHINAAIEGTDNLSVNFSLDDLEEYICLVKEEAGDNYGELGLRVYLGAKMETLSSGTQVPRTTVFFAPTSGAGENICNIPGISLLNMGDSGNNRFGDTPCNGG